MKFSGEVLDSGGGGHAVVVPAEVAATFSSKRPLVLALVNGTEYRSRLAVYSRTSYLGLRKDLLRAIGVSAGEVVEIELSEEPEPPAPAPVSEPEEPGELTAALAGDDAARTVWEGLAPSHRREYNRWIGEGVKPATRAERAARTIKRLKSS